MPDNPTVWDTEECGVKVALIWALSKGTELLRKQEDLVRRQFYAQSDQKQVSTFHRGVLYIWSGSAHPKGHPVLGKLKGFFCW